MLILCDFDGTITLQDVTNLYWDELIGPRWRTDILPAYKEGRISHYQIMVDGYKEMNHSLDHLLAMARGRVALRAGFENLKKLSRNPGWNLEIVSGGLDFYIREFIGDALPVHCYGAKLEEHWKVLPPAGSEHVPHEDFKVNTVRRMQQRHAGKSIVYIGDGRNDFGAASLCDQVFAVKGSYLARALTASGKGCVEFETFDEICGHLNPE